MCHGVAFYSIKSLINWGFVICLYNLTMLNLKVQKKWCVSGVRIKKKFNPLCNHGSKTNVSISVHDTCSYNVKCGVTFGFNSLFLREK